MNGDITQILNDLNAQVRPPIVGVEEGQRALRDKLLQENVDTFNPIRYAELTAEQQQELAAYRQALLDLTKQAGWPTDVVFPTPPSFV